MVLLEEKCSVRCRLRCCKKQKQNRECVFTWTLLFVYIGTRWVAFAAKTEQFPLKILEQSAYTKFQTIHGMGTIYSHTMPFVIHSKWCSFYLFIHF